MLRYTTDRILLWHGAPLASDPLIPRQQLSAPEVVFFYSTKFEICVMNIKIVMQMRVMTYSCQASEKFCQLKIKNEKGKAIHAKRKSILFTSEF